MIEINNRIYKYNYLKKKHMNKIIGIGIDIEEIERFKKENINKKTLNKIFTENELKYCFGKDKPEESLAARFCAKEAIIKASEKKLSYKDINITLINKKPCVEINKEHKYQIFISMSHTKKYATSNAIIIEESK